MNILRTFVNSTLLWSGLFNVAYANHAGDIFLSDHELPEVLTATHLYQAPAAVPGSVTTIDQELIAASGVRNIIELMRLVPGMLVVPDSSNLGTVNYHGSSPGQARRLQVLIDGRSVYRAAFAQVDWSDLPIALEDIQRIEVFRGPNTVSYGANALMGVINIITYSPEDTHGTLIKSNIGSNGIRDAYARQAWHNENTDLRLSISSLTDDGFEFRRDGNDFRDSRRLSRFNLRATHQLDEQNSLDWQLAFKEGSNQVDNHYKSPFASKINIQPGEQDDNSDLQSKDYAASLRWNTTLSPQHSLSIQTNLQQWERLREWRSCDANISFSSELNELWRISSAAQRQDIIQSRPISNPSARQKYLQGWLYTQLQQPNLPYSCGLINEDSRESRFDLEIQDTYSFSEHLRLISGLSYRYDQARSKTFLNGRQRKDTLRAFSQFEWYATEHWLLQGGGMLEHDSNNGDSFSPRLAVNYLFSPAHSVRAVYSQAVRSPDMFENHADWQYHIRDLRPAIGQASSADFFLSAQGTGKLRQEKMRAFELGYNGYFAANKLSLDVKLFDEKVSRMISHRPSIEAFITNNNDQIRFYGGELETNWHATEQDRLRLTYAYIDERATHTLDQNVTPPHSGSLAWLRSWDANWSSSLMYFAAQQLNQNDLQLVTARVSKDFHLQSTRLQLAVNLQKALNNQPIGRTNNKDNSHDTIYASVQLEF